MIELYLDLACQLSLLDQFELKKMMYLSELETAEEQREAFKNDTKLINLILDKLKTVLVPALDLVQNRDREELYVELTEAMTTTYKITQYLLFYNKIQISGIMTSKVKALFQQLLDQLQALLPKFLISLRKSAYYEKEDLRVKQALLDEEESVMRASQLGKSSSKEDLGSLGLSTEVDDNESSKVALKGLRVKSSTLLNYDYLFGSEKSRKFKAGKNFQEGTKTDKTRLEEIQEAEEEINELNKHLNGKPLNEVSIIEENEDEEEIENSEEEVGDKEKQQLEFSSKHSEINNIEVEEPSKHTDHPQTSRFPNPSPFSPFQDLISPEDDKRMKQLATEYDYIINWDKTNLDYLKAMFEEKRKEIEESKRYFRISKEEDFFQKFDFFLQKLKLPMSKLQRIQRRTLTGSIVAVKDLVSYLVVLEGKWVEVVEKGDTVFKSRLKEDGERVRGVVYASSLRAYMILTNRRILRKGLDSEDPEAWMEIVAGWTLAKAPKYSPELDALVLDLGYDKLSLVDLQTKNTLILDDWEAAKVHGDAKRGLVQNCVADFCVFGGRDEKFVFLLSGSENGWIDYYCLKNKTLRIRGGDRIRKKEDLMAKEPKTHKLKLEENEYIKAVSVAPGDSIGLICCSFQDICSKIITIQLQEQEIEICHVLDLKAIECGLRPISALQYLVETQSDSIKRSEKLLTFIGPTLQRDSELVVISYSKTRKRIRIAYEDVLKLEEDYPCCLPAVETGKYLLNGWRGSLLYLSASID